MFKKAKKAPLNTLNLFGKMFYHFFCHIHGKCFCNFFFDFLLIVNYLNIGLKKKKKITLVQKKSFPKPNLIQKPTKIEKKWFLREYCEISAHTDVPNLFFPFWTACLPWTETLFRPQKDNRSHQHGANFKRCRPLAPNPTSIAKQ